MLRDPCSFEATFVTSKDPDDIIEFYQAEDLLKVFTMSVPGAFEFIMSGTRFDEEAKEGWDATVHTTFGGVQLMETCFALSEEEEETDDGETVVGYFNRHERFKNFFPLTKLLLWDQCASHPLDSGPLRSPPRHLLATPWPGRGIMDTSGVPTAPVRSSTVERSFMDRSRYSCVPSHPKPILA